MTRNWLGERAQRTYRGWRRAVLAVCPMARFDGDRDICEALYPGPTLIAIGHWGGDEGSIY